METFVALADPVRARIVEMLAEDDLKAGDIAAAFAISRPAVSRHLSVLLKSGLVQVREDAQRRIYGLDPAGLETADAWLEEIRDAWNRRRAAGAVKKAPYDWDDGSDEPWRALARRVPIPRGRGAPD
jgi:DNA-binding transcriptional ArsR family regulator